MEATNDERLSVGWLVGELVGTELMQLESVVCQVSGRDGRLEGWRDWKGYGPWQETVWRRVHFQNGDAWLKRLQIRGPVLSEELLDVKVLVRHEMCLAGWFKIMCFKDCIIDSLLDSKLDMCNDTLLVIVVCSAYYFMLPTNIM